jgi:hypothetical protein
LNGGGNKSGSVVGSDEDRPIRWQFLDLFGNVVPRQRRHPSFVALTTGAGHQAARIMMQRVAVRLHDVDGNFVEQFQSTGFDARVWELYLLAALEEVGLQVTRPRPSPDFECTDGVTTFFVEAVTANPTDTRSAPRPLPPTTPGEWFEALRRSEDAFDWHAIRLGSALFSKLQKRYAERPAVGGKPFVLAIESFADGGSLFQTDIPLLRYLFGRELVDCRGPGDVVESERPLTAHTSSAKTIPSGFFFQVGAESVSAVLFSNEGTVAKFSRMGLQAGLGAPNVRSWRYGICSDPDPSATVALEFSYEVGTIPERWSDGLVVIHNPIARHPLDPSLFPSAVHHMDVDGVITSRGPPFHVYASHTITLHSTPQPLSQPRIP